MIGNILQCAYSSAAQKLLLWCKLDSIFVEAYRLDNNHRKVKR